MAVFNKTNTATHREFYFFDTFACDVFCCGTDKGYIRNAKKDLAAVDFIVRTGF